MSGMLEQLMKYQILAEFEKAVDAWVLGLFVLPQMADASRDQFLSALQQAIDESRAQASDPDPEVAETNTALAKRLTAMQRSIMQAWTSVAEE